MVTFPTLAVEASFLSGQSTQTYLQLGDPTRGLLGTGTLAPGTVWTDIAPWLRRAALTRGATRVQGPLTRAEAGTSSGTFDNRDRRFDPTNLAGPYVSAGATQLTPMRGIRYRATWAGVTYDLHRAYIDAIPVGYQQPSESEATLSATDAYKILGNINRAAGGAVGAGEDSGARVNRVLNSVNWPATDRLIAVGDSAVQATTLVGDALAELQLVSDTELGDLYVDGGGRVVYRNRQAWLEELRSAQPMAMFGDQPIIGQATTINLLRYPSSETTIGWIAGGFANPPTITQDATHVQAGSQAALVTWATASGGDLPQASVVAPALITGRVYTFSCYAYVPAGSPAVTIFADGRWGDNITTANDTWQRLTWTGAVSAAPYFQIWPQNSATTAGQQVWLDAAQLEEAPAATAYCDGDQVGCQWDGNAHESSSRRLVELAYSDVTLDYDDTQLVNLVQAARAGGSVQTAQDAASQALYGVRTDPSSDRSDLLHTSDAETLNWASWVLYQSKDPELRFSQLVINPLRDPVGLFPQVLGRELGDRIRIVRRPPGGGAAITRDVFIRGITHVIDCQRRTWLTTWTLQSATKYSFFVLGSSTLGVLGSNALAY